MFLANIIADTIMEFVPRSNSARVVKQKSLVKKVPSPKHLPAIK